MNARMIKTFLVGAAFLLCFQSTIFGQIIPPIPHPVAVKGNWNIIYTNPDPRQPANDFHICGVIQSLNNVQPILHNYWAFGGGAPWYLEEFTIDKVPNHAKNWYFTAHFQTDSSILPGTLMHFGLHFITNYCNKAVVNCAYWTFFKEAVGRMPVIGFHIYWQGGTRAALINNAGVSATLSTIEVAVSNQEIPLEDMFTPGLGNPGEKSSNQKYANLGWKNLDNLLGAKDGQIQIDSDKPLDFDLTKMTGIKLKDGQFMLIRGYTIFQGKKIAWWIQHEDPGVDAEF